jgi:uncharacterized membrane protein required for colicin V production
MNESLWWVFDGIAAAAILLFVIITIKRGLVKAIVSAVGFVLAAVIAISAGGSIASSIYRTAVRDTNVKNINRAIDGDTLVDKLAEELENSEYGLSVNKEKLRSVLMKSDDHDSDIYKFVNNINGKKVAEEGVFDNVLHNAYSNIIRDIVSKDLSKYAAECAADKVYNEPSVFRDMIPQLMDDEDQKAASEYICTNLVDEPYISSLKFIVMIVIMGVIMLLSVFIAGAIGRNDTMEPGFMRHFLCAAMGIAKGAAIVLGIAIAVRISVVYGSDRSLMTSHPAIEKSYVFKYVYDFVCGLK